jgi:hypothetical protein
MDAAWDLALLRLRAASRLEQARTVVIDAGQIFECIILGCGSFGKTPSVQGHFQPVNREAVRLAGRELLHRCWERNGSGDDAFGVVIAFE